MKLLLYNSEQASRWPQFVIGFPHASWLCPSAFHCCNKYKRLQTYKEKRLILSHSFDLWSVGPLLLGSLTFDPLFLGSWQGSIVMMKWLSTWPDGKKGGDWGVSGSASRDLKHCSTPSPWCFYCILMRVSGLWVGLDLRWGVSQVTPVAMTFEKGWWVTTQSTGTWVYLMFSLD